MTRTLVLALALGVALSACARKSTGTSGYSADPARPTSAMSRSDMAGAVDYWGKRYDKEPKSKKVGLNYATALRITGRNEQALGVMRKMVIHHPKDRQVLSAYGKALAGAGQFKKALGVIQRAQRDDQPDWKLYSAEGTIHDQLGRPAEARAAYSKALAIEANEPSVLSNLGMSHLLTGDLKSSEQYLRQAVSRPGADSQVRQNLALVVGLQGRFDEAERIASAELSPAEARENIKTLRTMLKQQNAWKDMKDKG